MDSECPWASCITPPENLSSSNKTKAYEEAAKEEHKKQTLIPSCYLVKEDSATRMLSPGYLLSARLSISTAEIKY
jgi:hypothetical protein